MKNYMDSGVVCPFYSQEEPLKLHCEGFSKCTRLQTFFENRVNKKAHKDKYCNNLRGYKQCPLYPVIEKQYKGGDDDED